MSSSFRLEDVVHEALQNIKSRIVEIVVQVVALSLIAAACLSISVEEVDRLISADRAEISMGVNVLHVTTTDGDPIAGDACEGLNAVEGVIAAGGRVSTETINASSTIDGVQSITGTQGLARAVWPDLQTKPDRFMPMIDRSASPAFEHRDFTAVNLDPGEATVFEIVDMGEPRVSFFAGSAYLPADASENVVECFVEFEPGYGTAITSLVQLRLESTSELLIQPLIAGERKSDLVDHYPTRTSLFLALGLGLVFLLVTVGSWLLRRKDMTIYLFYGLRPRRLMVMLAIDWSVLVYLPSALGLLTALYVADPQYPLTVYAVGNDWLRAALLGSIAPPAFALWLMATSRLDGLTRQ